MAPEIFFGLGALLLGAGILYAMLRNRTRNRANDALGEEATREIYRQDPETYSSETRPEIKAQVKPDR